MRTQTDFRVLIVDLVGLRFDSQGQPDSYEVAEYILARGGSWTLGPWDGTALSPGVHFFYMPDLSTPAELQATCCDGQYHAVIAAATFLPEAAVFPEGGVRIGAGTGNMGCACWGGPDGIGGAAPLMNTPGVNSRATAQMAMKALLKIMPDLDVATLHARVLREDFDTGRDLRDYPTAKLEGKRMAVLGYGNIGRELAKLGRAFGMEVAVYARPKHRDWIEAEGFVYAPSPEEAARGADVLSPHLGLGPGGCNIGVVNEGVLNALTPGAILINYDRGELVDADALDGALASGRVAYAAIDADIFLGADGPHGPMVPYLGLAERYPNRLELLPHAAADTDHPSRVAGAKQAVDQILAAIFDRVVINAKGDIPQGYQDGGAQSPAGIGAVLPSHIAKLDVNDLEHLRACAAQLEATLAGLTQAMPEARLDVAKRDGSELLRAANNLRRDLVRFGLEGPFYN